MKHTAIFAMSVALLAFSSRAADTPSGSTNAPTVTNAPHLHPTFTERLHQIQKHDATNKAPDHLTSPKFVEQQIQQSQPIKRPVVVLPPIPPEPTK